MFSAEHVQVNDRPFWVLFLPAEEPGEESRPITPRWLPAGKKPFYTNG